MFPYRGNGGRGRGCDKCGDVGRGPGRGVEASGAGGKPEVVSGDTRPLEVVDMVVGMSYRWRPGSREGSQKNIFLIGLGLEH